MAGYALVTGASRGIGAEFARQLGEEGHPLILSARNGQELSALREEILAKAKVPFEVVVIEADLSLDGGARHLFDAIVAKGLEVDLLVNNAGAGDYGAFIEHPEDRVLAIQRLNMLAPAFLCRVLIPKMVERGSGAVINVASTIAFQATPHMALYAATKAFVLSLSEALSIELEGSGVTVTALCPGPTKTHFLDAAGMKPVAGDGFFESAQIVAARGLEAARRGEAVRISGMRNWLGAQGQRILPRRTIARLAGNIMKRSLGG